MRLLNLYSRGFDTVLVLSHMCIFKSETEDNEQ